MIRKGPAARVSGRVGHNPIAPVPLSAIERLIGALQDQLRRVVRKFERGDHHARRHFEGADPLPGIEGSRSDALAQALSHQIGLGQVGVRHDHDKLLPAEPAGQVDAANVATHARGELTEHGIACVMAIAVVDCLEIESGLPRCEDSSNNVFKWLVI